MDKVENILRLVPLPVLVLGAILPPLVFLMIPRQWRLPVALMLLPPWLAMNLFHAWGVAFAIAKALAVMGPALIILAAWMHPGPRRQLPGIAWLYVFTAFAGFVYMHGTIDRMHGFANQVQWVLMVGAGLAVTRTIVDADSLRRVLKPLTVGFVITFGMILTSLIVQPRASFSSSWGGRFFPWGANANSIGSYLFLGAPLVLYEAQRAGGLLWAVTCYFATAVGCIMGLLTASRSTVGPLGLALLPLLKGLARNPLFAAIAVVVMLVGVIWTFSLTGDQRVMFGRLGSLESFRYLQADAYMAEIAKHPVFGLLFVSGQSYRMSTNLGYIPHNTYTHILWMGGVSYLLPHLVLIGATLLATLRVWRHRLYLPYDPLLITLLSVYVIIMYAHGLTSSLLITSNNIMSFFHIFVSMFFICVARDLKFAHAWGHAPLYAQLQTR